MDDETNTIYTAPSGNVADEWKRTGTLYYFTANHSFISCGFLAAKYAVYITAECTCLLLLRSLLAKIKV
jgi:hypothetical protein